MTAKPTVDPLEAAARKSFAAAFGAILKLEPDTGACVWIDGRTSPPALSSSPPSSAETCVWRGPQDALLRAIASNRAFESAFVAGRILVAGDMSVPARVTLGDGR